MPQFCGCLLFKKKWRLLIYNIVFLMYSKVSHSFLDSLPMQIITEYRVPCPNSTSLLVTYLIYSSVYMGHPKCHYWSRTCLALQEISETWVRSLGWEDPPEEGMATHSSIFAWRIPCQRSLAGYSPQGHREWDTTEVT